MTVRITIPKLTEEEMKNDHNTMIVHGMMNTAKVCTPFAHMEAVLPSNDGISMDRVQVCDVRVILPSLCFQEELDARSTDSFRALMSSLMISASVIKPNVYIDTYIPVPNGLVLPATAVSQTGQVASASTDGGPIIEQPSGYDAGDEGVAQQALPQPDPPQPASEGAAQPARPRPASEGVAHPPPQPASVGSHSLPPLPGSGQDELEGEGNELEAVLPTPTPSQGKGRGRGGRGRGRPPKQPRGDDDPVSRPSKTQRQEEETSHRRSTRGDQPSPAVPGCDEESPGPRSAIRGAGAIESSPKRFKRPPGRAPRDRVWNEILGAYVPEAD